MNRNDNIFDEYAMLLSRYRAGDETAFEEIYRKSERMVYTVCFGILNNEEDAYDAMQDTYITVYKKLDSLKDDKSFVSWIKTIATTKSLDAYKKKKGDVSYDDAVAVDESLQLDDNLETLPDTYIMETTKRETLDKLIREVLSDVQYQTIHMFYYSGFSIEKIAEMMECPPGTVKARLKSARVKIKEGVKKYEKDNKDAFAVASTSGVPFLTRFFNTTSDSINLPMGDISAITGSSEGPIKETAVPSVADKGTKSVKKGPLSNTASKALLTGVVAVVGIAVVFGIVKLIRPQVDSPAQTSVTSEGTPTPTPTPAPVTVNVFDYIDVTFSGMNRRGSCDVYIDPDMPVEGLSLSTQKGGGVERTWEITGSSTDEPQITLSGVQNDDEITIAVVGDYEGFIIEPSEMTYVADGLSRFVNVNESETFMYWLDKGMHLFPFPEPSVTIDDLDNTAINNELAGHVGLDYQGRAFRYYYYNIGEEYLSLLMCYTDNGGEYYEIGNIDYETGEITWEADAQYPDWAPRVTVDGSDAQTGSGTSVPNVHIAGFDSADFIVELWDHRDVGDSYSDIRDYSYIINDDTVEIYIHFSRYTDPEWYDTGNYDVEEHYDIASIDINTGEVTWTDDAESAPDWA